MAKKKKASAEKVRSLFNKNEVLVLCESCKTNMIREDDGLCEACFWKVFNQVAFGPKE